MRFIHTGDWHLGKVLHGQSMINDQRDMLMQLVNAVKSTGASMVVLSGDVFDSKDPSREAVKLFNDVLHALILDIKIKVLAIAGNHDCPLRLGFGNGLMKASGFHVMAELQESFEPIEVEDEHGPIWVYMVPYASLETIKNTFGERDITSYSAAYELILRKIQKNRKPDTRTIIVTHALVSPGGMTFDTDTDHLHGLAEHEWQVPIPLEYFTGFHYTALGHLHEPLMQDNHRASYPGAPLKYSFKKNEMQPGFNVVDMDGTGHVTIERWPVIPVKDLMVVEGKLSDILQYPVSENYVEVRLLDEAYVSQVSKMIREVYPNVLLIRHMYHHKPHHHFAVQEPQYEAGLRNQCEVAACGGDDCRHGKRVKHRMNQLIDKLSPNIDKIPVCDLK